MLELLPPVCRDCGRAVDEAKLSPYLDFHLCAACIAKRERDVLGLDRRRRKAPSKKGRQEGAAESEKKPKAKKPGGRGRRT